MKICFATEVTYPNYVNRIKQSSLSCFIKKKLDELGVFYYISTNLPNNFEEYKNNDYIKVFGIDDLRKDNIESQKYELFPEDPTGLYPSRYPWNARRFIIEQAAKDGFDYIIYIDADTVFRPDLTTEEFYNQIIAAYEPNTVKTNSTIFKYKSRSPEDVFNFHNLYIKHFNLNFEEDDYDTIDGPCQVFIGYTNQDILRLTSNWNKFAIFGYKREFGYGYGNNKHGNLSFVIPLSGFKLKWQGYPFYPNHITTDRYTHENRFTPVVEQPIEESPLTQTVSSDLSQILSSYSCDKVASKYTGVYEFLLNPLKDEKIKLLEIGVGTVSKTPLDGMSHVPSTMYGWKETHQNYNPGASLRGWRDFFVNGEIYGVDIQPDCLIEEERIKTFIFDSRSTEKTNQHFEDDSLNIIIDDGNHDPNFQIHTIINFYKKLKNHGLYIIEDVFEPETVRNYLKDNNIDHVYHDVRMITIKKNGTINFTKNEVFDEMKKPEITELKPAVEPINFVNEEKEFKINGIKFADRGFFINLNKSTDRLGLVVKQIKQFNIEGLNRFEALTDEWIHFSCTKSHLKVFETSLLEDYDTIFVAEDDFLIEENCFFPHGDKQNIHNVLSKVSEDLNSVEWDVLLFGCNPKAPLIPITNNLAVVNKSTGAWAYLIKKRAYRYLLKNSNYKKDVIAIDDWLPILNDKGFITLTTIPLTINHGVGLVSTLQPAGPVNYDGWIKGSYHKFLYDLYPNNNFLSNNIQNNITVVIAGHFVDDFLFYLNYLLHSLPEELKKCKILVNYDISNELEPNAKKVMLSAFFRDVKHSMNTSVSFSYGGLISSIDNIIEQIRTPYFVFLEHDWVFLKKDSIDFDKLLTVFNIHNFVNAVWFAKDNNNVRAFEITDDIDGSTTPFIKEERVNECDLVTTCRWSNNPVIFRVSKFKEWFYGIIKNEHTGKTSQGSHNVEETMIPFYREIIKERGWNNVRDEWGTFLYGNIGEGPYVGHTDASRRYQGISKSQPEINGEEYIKNNPL
jgi:GR25 family glycosyltransferase involved in LPS biosynthesis